MANNLKNMIEVIGETPTENFPTLPTTNGTWKQLSIPETITIPCHKPDIEQIIKVVVIPEITFNRVVNTPNGTNLESDKTTGKKLVVEGVLHQQIVYVANIAQQSVHSVEVIVPFSTYIVLNAGNIELADKFEVESFIEDIFIQQLGAKTIFKNITLFVLAQQKV